MPLIPKVPINEWNVQPSPPDPRDYMYSMKIGMDGSVPRKVFNRRLTTRNQGIYGTCGGQAGAYAKDIREGCITSSLYIYKNAWKLSNIPNEGVYMRSLMQAMKDYGVCAEVLYPYELYKGNNVFPAVTQDVLLDAENRKIEGYARCMLQDEFINAIYKYKSIISGAIVTTSFKEGIEVERGNAFIPMPDGYILGGHAIHHPAYDLDMEHTYADGRHYKGFVYVDNSWGEDWGINGGAWMPIAYLLGRDKDLGMQYCPDVFAPIDEWKEVKQNIRMDVKPTIINDRALIPIRYIAEGLGAMVNYYDDVKAIEVIQGKKTIYMWIDSYNMQIITRK